MQSALYPCAEEDACDPEEPSNNNTYTSAMTAEWQTALSGIERNWRTSLSVDHEGTDAQDPAASSSDAGVVCDSEFDSKQQYVESRMKLRAQKLQKQQKQQMQLATLTDRFSLIDASLSLPNGGYRPYSCQNCQTLLNGATQNANDGGLTNLLDLPALTQSKKGFGFFTYIRFVRSRRLHTYKKFSGSVVVDASVKKVSKQLTMIQRKSVTGRRISSLDAYNYASDQTQKVLTLARSIYNEMAADISNGFLRFVGWVLLKVFRRCYANICYQQQDVEYLRQADEMKIPVIYLPLHKSHLDYMVISLILFCNDIKVPHIAAGDNLGRVPILGYILRKVGAFIVRRRNSGRKALDIASYNAVLQEYMEQLLRNNESITIFIEGTRTRCGKPLLPKTGLLSCVTQAVILGTIPDALVVPVGLSYDLIPEHSGYANEAIGAPKEPESIWQLIRGAYRMLRSNKGQIRINFGKPYSVKGFCDRQRGFSSKHYTESPRVSESSANLNVILRMTESMVETTKDLGLHLINDSEMICNQMATNMVAFLMLNVHRNGVFFPQLLDSFTWLREELASYNRTLGFSWDSDFALRYGIDLLQTADMLLVRESKEGEGTGPYIALPSTAQSHLGLVQHGNQVSSNFVRKAIVGSALVRCIGGFQKLKLLKERDYVIVSLNEVKTHARLLSQLLWREFIIAPPCLDFETWFEETWYDFTFSGMVKNNEDKLPPTAREKSLAYSFDLYDESESISNEQLREVEYQVITTEECVEALSFYCAIIAPFLESYWLTASHLLSLLPNKEVKVPTFLSEVHTFAQTRVFRGFTQFPETASLFVINNSLQFLEDSNVVASTSGEKDSRTMELTPSYRAEKPLVYFISSINQFRK